jgi:hypothetical protein
MGGLHVRTRAGAAVPGHACHEKGAQPVGRRHQLEHERERLAGALPWTQLSRISNSLRLNTFGQVGGRTPSRFLPRQLRSGTHVEAK